MSSELPKQSPAKVVVIGLGQLGGVFAHAALRQGHTVIPVRRQDSIRDIAAAHPEVLAVLITVGEDDLPTVLCALPDAWKSKGVLVQNELLPCDYHPLAATMCVVWFEKKATTGIRIIRPSPTHGPLAQEVVNLLQSIDVPAFEVSLEQLKLEMLAKNIYILAMNILGLKHPVPVGELWSTQNSELLALSSELLAVQEARLGHTVDRDTVMKLVEAAVLADPSHGSRGRSAEARLERVLRQASAYQLVTPRLDSIQRRAADG